MLQIFKPPFNTIIQAINQQARLLFPLFFSFFLLFMIGQQERYGLDCSLQGQQISVKIFHNETLNISSKFVRDSTVFLLHGKIQCLDINKTAILAKLLIPHYILHNLLNLAFMEPQHAHPLHNLRQRPNIPKLHLGGPQILIQVIQKISTEWKIRIPVNLRIGGHYERQIITARIIITRIIAQPECTTVQMPTMNNLLADLVKFGGAVMGDSKVFEDIKECPGAVLHGQVAGYEVFQFVPQGRAVSLGLEKTRADALVVSHVDVAKGYCEISFDFLENSVAELGFLEVRECLYSLNRLIKIHIPLVFIDPPGNLPIKVPQILPQPQFSYNPRNRRHLLKSTTSLSLPFLQLPDHKTLNPPASQFRIFEYQFSNMLKQENFLVQFGFRLGHPKGRVEGSWQLNLVVFA